MATLNGYGMGAYAAPATSPQSTNPEAIPGSDTSRNMVVIDGTPIRIVVLALSAAAGLTALRLAGFKFNVGVSS